MTHAMSLPPYTVLVLIDIFSILNQSFTLQSSPIDTIPNKMPGPFAPKLWIVCTNKPSSKQKIGYSSVLSNYKRALAHNWNSF